MTTDWTRLTRPQQVVGESVHVPLDGDRGHWVSVLAHEDGWELSGFAATHAQLADANLDVAELWRRNRYLNLVGYVVDNDGSAWVTAWLPLAGITKEEFREVMWHVAVEADRLEFYCSGEDTW